MKKALYRFAAFSLAPLLFGYYISAKKIAEAVKPQANVFEIQTQDTPEPPAFTFSLPFSPREELEKSLSLEKSSERYGRLLAIGYHSAQSDPIQNIQALSPEIWEYKNYDLRGAFLSEWMRRSPDEFLQWAEPKYQELEDASQLRLFPSYHLAYLEPIALLNLLPKVQNANMLQDLKSSVLSTLVELDPDLAWNRRNEFGGVKEIFSEACQKRLFPTALNYWEQSGWQALDFDDDLFEFVATQNLTEYAARFKDYDQTQFVTHYARHHPLAAASWVRSLPTLYDFEYEFEPEHAAYFQALFQLDNFPHWSDASAWIVEAINADEEQTLQKIIFNAIALAPAAGNDSRLKTEFRNYLYEGISEDTVKHLYASIDNDHPILEILEPYMLTNLEEFGQALASRAGKEPPPPHRFFKILRQNNVDSWPEDYRTAARQTLDTLSDEELLWSLSPGTILSARNLDPERIQYLIDNSEPEWLLTTLTNPTFINSVNINELASLDSLTQDLPSEQATRIKEEVSNRLIRQTFFVDNKTPYVALAANSQQAKNVARAIPLDEFQDDSALQDAISNHPLKNDFYLAIANSHRNQTFSDPNLQRAANTIEQAQKLSALSTEQIVSTLQSLPSQDSFLLAKASLLAQDSNETQETCAAIVDMKNWSDEQKQELYELSQPNTQEFQFEYSCFHFAPDF